MIARAHLAGFKAHREIAEVLGCRVEQISRWAQMEEPPAEMRKGFDERMILALQTTRQMLFRDYVSTPPGRAQFVHEGQDVRALLSHDGDFEPSTFGGAGTLFSLLTPSEQDKVFEFTAMLLLAKNDHRRGAVESVVGGRGLVNRPAKVTVFPPKNFDEDATPMRPVAPKGSKKESS